MTKTPLQKYLDAYKLTQLAFAEISGVSQPAINFYARGVRIPSPENAATISKATEGKITEMQLLYPDRYPEFEIENSAGVA